VRLSSDGDKSHGSPLDESGDSPVHTASAGGLLLKGERKKAKKLDKDIQAKVKKMKKGEATAKQRLSKKLKMHKMLF